MPKAASLEETIETELRRAIVSGELRPGDRLPTRPELEKRFDAATQTVQRAVSRLMRDGFLVARGKLGTFVAQYPPHRHRYGVVIAGDPTVPLTAASAKFQAFLYREALNLRRATAGEGGREISIYLSINGHADGEDFTRLVEDVRSQRLAGLVFDMPTYLVQPPLSELLDVNSLPCVTMAKDPPNPMISAVNLSVEDLVERAVEYLHDRGCRQVAMLAGAADDRIFHYFERLVNDRGMSTRLHWQQSVSPHSTRSARNCAHLLMQGKERPDALLISDDSLVEHATAGLIDAGVRVPDELTVIAHANFPYATPSLVRAQRVGFDVREVLRTCLELIDARHAGQPVPAVTHIRPILEDEVQPVMSMPMGADADALSARG